MLWPVRQGPRRRDVATRATELLGRLEHPRVTPVSHGFPGTGAEDAACAVPLGSLLRGRWDRTATGNGWTSRPKDLTVSERRSAWSLRPTLLLTNPYLILCPPPESPQRCQDSHGPGPLPQRQDHPFSSHSCSLHHVLNACVPVWLTPTYPFPG